MRRIPLNREAMKNKKLPEDQGLDLYYIPLTGERGAPISTIVKRYKNVSTVNLIMHSSIIKLKERPEDVVVTQLMKGSDACPFRMTLRFEWPGYDVPCEFKVHDQELEYFEWYRNGMAHVAAKWVREKVQYLRKVSRYVVCAS